MTAMRSSLDVTLSVWKALFLREAVTRLAAGRGAWVWLLLDPVAQIAFLMVIFSAIRARAGAGVDFTVFLAIGVLGYQMFRSPADRAMEAIAANAALFSYRQVKPIDAVISRCLLEGLLQILVAAVLMSGTALLGLEVLPRDPLQFGAAYALLWCFGTGLGMALSVGNVLVPEIGKIARLVFMPLYLVSGVMFSPHILPPAARDWLMLNPVMQGIEMMRVSFFSSYPPLPSLDRGYLAGCALLALFLGLALQVRYARRLVTL
ncbi:MAG: ABC transporter permease [Betaproteobacteria bacterium]|nr:ABC transporter permease [Betaproteobacteria bacterium]